MLFLPASLTDDEIAAIDEAGAKGPPTLMLLRNAARPDPLLLSIVLKIFQVSLGMCALLYLVRRFVRRFYCA